MNEDLIITITVGVIGISLTGLVIWLYYKFIPKKLRSRKQEHYDIKEDKEVKDEK